MGFIYMLTSPSGKSYIGQSTRTIEERFKAHQLLGSQCVAISNAIQKHGWNNFEKHWYEVPDEDLNDHEELMVEVLGTLAPDGYNLRKGGGSKGSLCEEVKQKMSESHKGKTHPDEVKQKISKTKTGKTLPDEVKQKISKTMTGKTHTDDTKKKLSESNKSEKNPMFGKTGEDHPAFGRTHTDDAKQKMSKNSHNSKKVYQYYLDDTFIQSFTSGGEAARSLNKTDGNSISKCALGKRKSAHGFIWSYTKL